MWSLKTLRFADIGTGLSAVIGSASLLFAGMAQAAEPVCNAPAPGCGPNAASCDQIYQNAGNQLNAYTAQAGCAPSSVCDTGKLFGSSGCDDGCGWCNLGEPWKLSKQEGFDYGGWIQMGYQNKPDGSFTGNGPFLNQKEWDKFNLNQLYLYATKVADGSKGVDWGFRFDAMYGVDGNDAQAFGNDPGHWDYLNGFDHGIYEFALPQAYGEIAVENLSVKIGHFYTPIGYEVVTSPDNFFYSRQVNFWNSEPFTHTGALGNYKATDKLSLTGGWVLGWDTGFDQFNNSSMGITGLVYSVSDIFTLTYMNGFGNFGLRGDGMVNSAILSAKWTEKFSTVHQFDVLGTNNNSNFQDPASLTAKNSTGLINYAFYQINDCLKAGARYEWYKADGTSYNTLTGGVNVIPHANVVIRPEVRYMWSPGNDADLWNATVFGIDAIVKF